MADQTPDELRAKIDELAVRHEKGIAWIREHDPDGSMYLWIKSGLTPASPMPAQSAERIEAWKSFYKNFRLWEAIDVRLASLEQRLHASAPAARPAS